MAPTKVQLGRCVAEWRASLLNKGLNVNAGKSKVMVGSSGGKMALWCMWERSTVHSINKNDSQVVQWCDVRGDLSMVADGFRCKRCDGTIQEADLADDLMVDGETYECVKGFCYMGDTLDGDDGAALATTARIRNGWMKCRELLPFLIS